MRTLLNLIDLLAGPIITDGKGAGIIHRLFLTFMALLVSGLLLALYFDLAKVINNQADIGKLESYYKQKYGAFSSNEELMNSFALPPDKDGKMRFRAPAFCALTEMRAIKSALENGGSPSSQNLDNMPVEGVEPTFEEFQAQNSCIDERYDIFVSKFGIGNFSGTFIMIGLIMLTLVLRFWIIWIYTGQVPGQSNLKKGN